MLETHLRYLVWILLIAGVAAAQEVYNPATGHFYRISSTPLDLAQARDFAASYGGHLVTVNDAAESAFLTSTFGPSTLMIGLTDTVTEGIFLWDSGEPITFTDWCVGEPNNVGSIGEDAVTMVGGIVSSCWNDVPVNLPYFAVIEYAPAPALFRWHYHSGTGNSYHLTPFMTLTQARNVAQAHGGHLASINSPSEQMFVRNLFRNYSVAIGLTDVAQEGIFVWDTLEPVNYTNFCPGEPNNLGNEDLVVILPSGCWNDVPAGGTYRFLIETSDLSVGRLLSSSEFGPAGTLLTSVPDAEGWIATTGSTASYSVVSGLAATHGSNWLAVSAPPSLAMPSINATTASSVNFTSSSVGEARKSFIAQTNALAFDWAWSSPESLNSIFNDFARVVLMLPGTSTIVGTAFYVDTFSQIAPGTPPPAFTGVISIPDQYIGQPLALAVQVGNQGDSINPSTFYIDNVRLIERLPGNSDQVAVAGASGPNGLYAPFSIEATANELLSIRMTSTNAIFRAAPPLLIASVGQTGTTPPPVIGFPDIHIDPTNPIVVFDPFANAFGLSFLPVGGLTLGFLVPPGLSGMTARFQYLSLSPSGPNGIWASSPALIVNVVP